ncbi:MAG: hypothetical protein ABSH20_08895 [Tepidisphaeraceae bacterium]|jgi:hypothetical protein
MSELRNQLRSARREYEALTYPGDLAGDVLRRQSRTRIRRVLWSVPFAAAAAVALAIVLHQPGKVVMPDQPAPVIVVQASTDMLAPVSPGLPGEASLIPPEPALLPPTQSLLAPAVPSLWETTTSDTTESNSKESV